VCLHEVIVASADRLIELFTETRAKAADAERERFLAEACGDDAHLKQQILSLLQAEDEEGDTDFLKRTPLIRTPALVTEKPGDKIGHYKLVQQLGEGSCGVVYVAEQEEPVRRRVALKVIKLGMDTKSVIARFEAERQALALMDHSNIAKVFDAGATETGRDAKAIACAALKPVISALGNPGPRVAANASSCGDVTPESRMAAFATSKRFLRCSRMAGSGTTPPYSACS
jgi:hypothetical protein